MDNERKQVILEKLAGRERLFRLYKAEASFGPSPVPAALKKRIAVAEAKLTSRARDFRKGAKGYGGGWAMRKYKKDPGFKEWSERVKAAIK